MKRMNLRKTLTAGILLGATALAASAVANPPQGNFGPDYGMGSGMMGGYGMGPGMMGGQGSGYGMGPGMMDGYASRADLNLTAEQRSKIAKIRNDVRRKHWDLMGKMQDEQAQMNEQYNSDQRDDAPLSKSYRDMSELRQQMFDLSLSARRQIDAVLTQEQRDKLKRG
jgi:Spy/CpxP family protein refolding chaperone